MLEPEIQSFVTLISRVLKVIQPLVFCQSVPFFVSLLVPEDVVRLRQKIQNDIHAAYSQELSVAAFVQRLIVCHEGQLVFLVLCRLQGVEDIPAR